MVSAQSAGPSLRHYFNHNAMCINKYVIQFVIHCVLMNTAPDPYFESMRRNIRFSATQLILRRRAKRCSAVRDDLEQLHNFQFLISKLGRGAPRRSSERDRSLSWERGG